MVSSNWLTRHQKGNRVFFFFFFVFFFLSLGLAIDLAVAAAFIQQHDYYGKAQSWKMDVFATEKMVPIETLQTPVHVETVVTSVWKGNRLVTPVGGGVMTASRRWPSSNLIADEDGQVDQAREKITLDDLAAGQWWWDAN